MPLSISPLKSHAALLVSQLQFYIYPISRNKSIARLLLEHDFLDSFIENNEKILSPLWQLLHQNNDLFSLYFEALFVILIKKPCLQFRSGFSWNTYEEFGCHLPFLLGILKKRNVFFLASLNCLTWENAKCQCLIKWVSFFSISI